MCFSTPGNLLYTHHTSTALTRQAEFRKKVSFCGHPNKPINPGRAES
jgi:hypothetical protein